MVEKMVFIYALCDPRTDEMRYIGKTEDPHARLTQHLRSAESGGDTWRDRWIRTVIESGLDPYMRLLTEIPESWWPGSERESILLYWSPRLTNTAPGGLGGSGKRYKPSPLLGKPKTLEHRRKISEAHKGKTFSLEHREKIRQSKLGHKRSEESIRKQLETSRKNKIMREGLVNAVACAKM